MTVEGPLSSLCYVGVLKYGQSCLEAEGNGA